MGIVSMGPPKQILLELADLVGVTTFVETGTFHGSTARWASNHFSSVFTIEKADSLYRLHCEELMRLRGVKPLLGDSRDVLPSILLEISGQKAIFWLDGHWAGGDTAGADDECPLLGELACLSEREGDIVLIDDARLFLCAPPRPHKAAAWPSVGAVVDALTRSKGQKYIQIIDDVIFAIPNDVLVKSRLISYAQERSTACWENFGALQVGYSKSGLRTLLAGVKRKLDMIRISKNRDRTAVLRLPPVVVAFDLGVSQCFLSMLG